MFISSASLAPSNVASHINLTERAEREVRDEKEVAAALAKLEGKKPKKKRGCSRGLGYFVSSKEDIEKTAEGFSERPMRLFAPFYAGLSAGMSICELRGAPDYKYILTSVSVFVGSGAAILVEESVLDGQYIRFALLATAPFLFCISLVCQLLSRKCASRDRFCLQFFCLQMFGNLSMMCVLTFWLQPMLTSALASGQWRNITRTPSSTQL